MNIPDDIIEQAARAIAPAAWDESTYVGALGESAGKVHMRRDQRIPLEQARAALSAAAPTLMAMAWDEGEQAGYENAKAEDWPTFPQTTNPYRKEQK